MRVHDRWEFFAGNTWDIDGTLYGIAPAPNQKAPVLNLTGWTVLWGLLDKDGASVIAASVVPVTIVDAAAGKIHITVPSSATGIAPDTYTDVLQIENSDTPPVRDTMWTGAIGVKAAPNLG